MGHKFAEIGFTPRVKALQLLHGSRANYENFENRADSNSELSSREAEFISERDSFYVASVSESGWPYVQHRGGPRGFMKVLDGKTIGFADYSGNRQYMTTGNVQGDDRVSLFFMDYPNRRRLKMFGRVEIVGNDHGNDNENDHVLSRLEDPEYPAQVERAFLIRVEGFDWNCPQHITPRFTEDEISATVETLQWENAVLRQRAPEAALRPSQAALVGALGVGQLELVVSGIRQLTPRVRGIELRHPSGDELPAVTAGSHLRLPVLLADGSVGERHYSICSDPRQRERYELAVLREDDGAGGSIFVHRDIQIGQRFNTDYPENHFSLAAPEIPKVLIAGGIGITPINAMSYELSRTEADFHLHYAGSSMRELALHSELKERLGERLTTYTSEAGQRLELLQVLRQAPADAEFYACGPDRLIAGLFAAAREAGIKRERIHVERFS